MRGKEVGVDCRLPTVLDSEALGHGQKGHLLKYVRERGIYYP
jgi:hypothetical protein